MAARVGMVNGTLMDLHGITPDVEGSWAAELLGNLGDVAGDTKQEKGWPVLPEQIVVGDPDEPEENQSADVLGESEESREVDAKYRQDVAAMDLHGVREGVATMEQQQRQRATRKRVRTPAELKEDLKRLAVLSGSVRSMVEEAVADQRRLRRKLAEKQKIRSSAPQPVKPRVDDLELCPF